MCWLASILGKSNPFGEPSRHPGADDGSGGGGRQRTGAAIEANCLNGPYSLALAMVHKLDAAAAMAKSRGPLRRDSAATSATQSTKFRFSVRFRLSLSDLTGPPAVNKSLVNAPRLHPRGGVELRNSRPVRVLSSAACGARLHRDRWRTQAGKTRRTPMPPG